MYISAWQAHTGSIAEAMEKAVEAGAIRLNDVVWAGPSGDIIIGDDAYDEDYAEYLDSGTVQEYLNVLEA